MWCLVSQPDAKVWGIQVDPKAIGQELLEKVCENLSIGPEADYFGLRLPNRRRSDGGATSPTSPTGQGVTTQIEDAAHVPTVTFADGPWVNLRNPLTAQRTLSLRVKFWVPPHRLLLESTRHLFYLHAKLDLMEGKMVVADWNVAAKLVAFIAQAEVGDCDYHCPPQAFYAQCHNIGPQEEKPIDYVERIIEYHCEIAGMRACTAEYQLLKEISNLESFGEELFFCKPPGPSNDNNAHNLYIHLLYHRKGEEEVEGRGKSSSMYASQTVGCLTTVGTHEDRVEGCGCKLGMCVGVGPTGIIVYRPGNGLQDNENETQSIPYTAIIRASPVHHTFKLKYLNSSGNEATLNIKMATTRSAAALYRAVTEKHAFYCCETVRSDVTKQFIRNFKGTIVSLFNEDTDLGKKYVFDIRRTYIEVYDNARRALFAAANAANCEVGACVTVPHPKGPNCTADCKNTRERSNSNSLPLESFACRVCMDQTMDTLFLPCRHVLCCYECAERCSRCPLCRGESNEIMKIYLPLEFTHRTVN